MIKVFFLIFSLIIFKTNAFLFDPQFASHTPGYEDFKMGEKLYFEKDILKARDYFQNALE